MLSAAMVAKGPARSKREMGRNRIGARPRLPGSHLVITVNKGPFHTCNSTLDPTDSVSLSDWTSR